MNSSFIYASNNLAAALVASTTKHNATTLMAALRAASCAVFWDRHQRVVGGGRHRDRAPAVAVAAAGAGAPTGVVPCARSVSGEVLRKRRAAPTTSTRRASLWTVDCIAANRRGSITSRSATAPAATDVGEGDENPDDAGEPDEATTPAAAAAAVPAAADAEDDESDPDSGSPAMFDRLANIFLKRDEEDWIGLLASSERWPSLKEGFFRRLKERASTEDDPEDMLRLSRLLRLMQGTSDRVARYAELLEEIQEMDEDLWEGLVTNRRGEFTTEFFSFLRFKLEAIVRAQAAAATDGRGPAAGATAASGGGDEKENDDEDGEMVSPSPGGDVDGEAEEEEEVDEEEKEARAKEKLKRERQASSASEDAADKERDDLARLATRLLSICEAFDEATKDQETMEEAAANFKELLEVETLEEMNQKIDQMAAEQKLDPALVLTAAKAYMSVKESPYVEEEVKDVMAHLYFKMKETMGRQQPKEVRILKYLLAMDNPQEIRSGLEDAFTPGPELTTQDEDYLFCEAPALLATIEAVLKAYEQQKGKANITGQAAELMQPEVIEKMKTIKFQIEGNFL